MVDREKQERFIRSGSAQGESSGNSSVDGDGKDYLEEENSSDNGTWKSLTEEGDDILEELTPCDTRVLVHSEEELSQCETFERIFPTPDTGHYLQYIDTNYYDLLLLAWERRHAKDRQSGQDRLATLTESVRRSRIFLVFTLQIFLSRESIWRCHQKTGCPIQQCHEHPLQLKRLLSCQEYSTNRWIPVCHVQHDWCCTKSF